MDHFIALTEYTINHDMVDFAIFRADGTVTLHMGSNVLTFEGDDAATLKTAFGRDTPPAADEAEAAPAKRRR
jgi:hypothetical protein